VPPGPQEQTSHWADRRRRDRTHGATGPSGIKRCDWRDRHEREQQRVHRQYRVYDIQQRNTPVFSLADVSVKSPIRFQISPVVNVTGPTITNLTAGAKFEIGYNVGRDAYVSWKQQSFPITSVRFIPQRQQPQPRLLRLIQKRILLCMGLGVRLHNLSNLFRRYGKSLGNGSLVPAI